jgi:hypothetical protein
MSEALVVAVEDRVAARFLDEPLRIRVPMASICLLSSQRDPVVPFRV